MRWLTSENNKNVTPINQTFGTVFESRRKHEICNSPPWQDWIVNWPPSTRIVRQFAAVAAALSSNPKLFGGSNLKITNIAPNNLNPFQEVHCARTYSRVHARLSYPNSSERCDEHRQLGCASFRVSTTESWKGCARLGFSERCDDPRSLGCACCRGSTIVQWWRGASSTLHGVGTIIKWSEVHSCIKCGLEPQHVNVMLWRFHLFPKILYLSLAIL